MDKASLYRESNAKPRSQTREYINEFGDKLRWRSEGDDSLIDIGCGCGDVTTEFLLPILPSNFLRLVAVDKSSEMIAYARKHYSQPKVTYDVLDIAGDLETFFTFHEPFDHLTSFFCLQWVQNQRKVAENIYKLLKPNGDFLLWFLAKGSMYDAYEVLSKNPRWSAYLEDYENFLSPYQRSNNIVSDYTKIICEAGFVNFGIEVRDVHEEFDRSDEIESKCAHRMINMLEMYLLFIFVELMIALDPFINRIPKEIHYEYVNDLINELRHDQFKYILRMKVLVAYGRKGNS